MKNRANIFRVLLTCFVVLSYICTFLPMLTAKTFGVEFTVSFAEMLDTDSLYDISMQLAGEKEALNMFRLSIIAHLFINLIICVLGWIRSKFATVIAMLLGLVQCGWWGLCAGTWRTQFSGGNYFFNIDVGMGLWGYVDAAVLVVIMCILILIFDKKKKAKHVIKETKTIENVKEGMLVCTSGEYEGANITLGEIPMILGRDKEKCQLIFNGEKISRIHCSISYDKEIDMYTVKDFSTNGTFLGKTCSDENRMGRGTQMSVQPGTFISISMENCFELK